MNSTLSILFLSEFINLEILNKILVSANTCRFENEVIVYDFVSDFNAGANHFPERNKPNQGKENYS